MEKVTCKALLLMGGRGERLKSTTPKQFLPLSGKPLFEHTAELFLSFPEFKEIILVCGEEWISHVKKAFSSPRIRVVAGGETRQDSSYLGLLACREETDFVVIHDAVRPFVSRDVIAKHLELLPEHGAINTCIPSTDTIVCVKDGATIGAIPDRSHYWRGQTPQSFAYPLILEAHKRGRGKKVSDDCSLAIEMGAKVHIVQGSEENIKITTPLDLFLGEQLIRTRTFSLKKGTLSLEGKRFAITGGTGGIGKALCEKLSEVGALPLLLSTSAPTYSVDLTDSEKTAEVFETLYQTYGLLDGLINCVGSLSLMPFHSLSQSEIDRSIATNLHALLYSCRYAKVKAGGHIVNLSSSAFTRGRKSYVLYSSAKAAVVNFTQGLAEERPDLCINAVVPKRTNTKLRRQNFPGEDPKTLLSAERVAEEILSLLKQSSGTGMILEVRNLA